MYRVTIFHLCQTNLWSYFTFKKVPKDGKSLNKSKKNHKDTSYTSNNKFSLNIFSCQLSSSFLIIVCWHFFLTKSSSSFDVYPIVTFSKILINYYLFFIFCVLPYKSTPNKHTSYFQLFIYSCFACTLHARTSVLHNKKHIKDKNFLGSTCGWTR